MIRYARPTPSQCRALWSFRVVLTSCQPASAKCPPAASLPKIAASDSVGPFILVSPLSHCCSATLVHARPEVPRSRSPFATLLDAHYLFLSAGSSPTPPASIPPLQTPQPASAPTAGSRQAMAAHTLSLATATTTTTMTTTTTTATTVAPTPRPAKRVRYETSATTSPRPAAMSISFLLNTAPAAAATPPPPPMRILASCSDLLHFAAAATPPSPALDDASSSVSAPPAAGPTLYACAICAKTFKERGNMTKHVKSVHAASPRPFACRAPGCGKTFSFRDGLNRHTATVHDHVRAHSCPVAGCDKRFKQRSHAAKHVRSCH
jgi:uncharacterized Zn-finger protein